MENLHSLDYWINLIYTITLMVEYFQECYQSFLLQYA